jgi:hypothetical protein
MIAKLKLKDIADFRIGYQFRGKVKPDPAGKVRVIQIKDIDAELRVHVSDLVAVNIDRPEPYMTRQGDVLFLSRGHRLYSVVVPEVDPNTIATGYFFILRPKEQVVLPEFLVWSMNQPDFHERLRPFHRGSHMPMIAKTDVENIHIDVPPMDVQQQILALNGLLSEERRLSASILEKRTALIQSVLRKLMRTNKDN